MKYYFTAFAFLLLFTYQQYAQTISGSVKNLAAEPLASATVYLSGTMNGGLTDMNGHFSIGGISEGYYKLIVSYIGYETREMDIYIGKSADTVINFILFERPSDFNEIIIEDERDNTWDKDLKKFKKLFFGSEYNSNSIDISNPEALRFSYRFINGIEIFEAVSEAPLKISNKKLGYDITFDLRKFLWNGSVFLYGYFAYFSEMKISDEKAKAKIKKNRRDEYNGSIRHFLKALFKYNLENEGFKIFECGKDSFGALDMFDKTSPVSPDTLLIFREGSDLKKIHFPVFLKVTFSEGAWYSATKISVIEYRPGCKAYVNEDGILFDPEGGIILHGSWSDKRIGSLLPLDYKPE